MPTYNYKCNNCSHVFEVFQGINDDKLTDCPKCHSVSSLKRLISGGTGMIFKGNGFYITDYKKSTKNDDKNKGNKKSENKKEKKDDKS